jgi:hypothetical protein
LFKCGRGSRTYFTIGKEYGSPEFWKYPEQAQKVLQK